MTWPGTHPDTEAGKPTDTGPNEPANTPPPRPPTPTNESPPRPPDDTTAGPNEWQPSTERPTQHVIQDIQIGTPPTPTSATPDTDSPPSDDHDTASENSSNHHDDTDPSPSDASDGSPRSATGKPRDWAGEIGATRQAHQITDALTCRCGWNPSEYDSPEEWVELQWHHQNDAIVAALRLRELEQTASESTAAATEFLLALDPIALERDRFFDEMVQARGELAQLHEKVERIADWFGRMAETLGKGSTAKTYRRYESRIRDALAGATPATDNSGPE